MSHTPEQLKAIETVGAHICVSAGAGSGKTRVLVDRIVHLLQHENVDLSEIVAITFTRKAASEMKERLRRKCYALAPQDDSAEMDRWRGFLHQIDSARITTIDSFCSGLLREHALWMQDDPDYAVMTDADAKLEPRRVAEETLTGLLNENDEAAVRVATAYGISGTVDVLVELMGQPNLHGTLEEYAGGTVEEVSERWRDVLGGYIRDESSKLLGAADKLDGAFEGSTNKYAVYRVLLQRILGGVLAGGSAGELVPLLEDAVNTKFSGARKGADVDERDYKALKDLAKASRAFITTFLLPYFREEVDPDAAALTHAAASVYERIFGAFREHKRGNSVKDFSDLLRDALGLLTSREELRDQIAGGIRYLMIDEFQDTNPAQWALAQRLMRTETQAGPELFIVGDVKQSIYRFRNADVTVFQEAQSETAETILLNKNFRTLPNVMDGINTFFAESGALKHVVDPWESLETYRPRAEGVHFEFLLNTLPGETNGRKTNVFQQRQAEAGRIADHVAAMCSEGAAYRIQEESADGEVVRRAVAYGDVALLFRKKSNMYLYENALKDCGIPYVTLGGSQYFYRQEVADLTNLLRALADPWDEHALLGFLRSPMVGLDDNSIVRLGWRKGLASEFYGEASLEDVEQQERLMAARGWFSEFREHVSAPVSELLQRILVCTDYEAILTGLPHGEQRMGNVRKMVDTAREMVLNGKPHLTEFVQYLEEQATPGVLEGDAPLMGEHKNAVTLMTIHGSKGLEFPVVILPDTSTPPKAGGNKMPIASHANFGFAAKPPSNGNGDVAPAMFSLLNAVNKEEDSAEDARVLYVAMTRAMDYLVVSGTVLEKENKKKKKDEEAGFELTIAKNSWLMQFDSVFGLRDAIEGGKVREGISIFDRAHGGDVQEKAEEVEGGAVSISELQIAPIEVADDVGTFMSTTAWLDARFPVGEGMLSEGFDAAQQTALIRGTVVHRYLELWDFSGAGAPDVEAFFAREYPAFSGDSEWAAYVEGVAVTLRDSAVYGVLREGEPIARELPFTVRIGEQWISGTIDALTTTGVIVDYKTGAYREEGVARYEMQLRLYARALEQLTGDVPGRGLLYFVDEGRMVEVDLGVGI